MRLVKRFVNRNKTSILLTFILIPISISRILSKDTIDAAYEDFSSAITSKDKQKPGFATLLSEYSLSNELADNPQQALIPLKKLNIFIKKLDPYSLNKIDFLYIDKNLPKPPSLSKNKYANLTIQANFFIFWDNLSKSALKTYFLTNKDIVAPNINLCENYKSAASSIIISSLKELIKSESFNLSLVKTLLSLECLFSSQDADYSALQKNLIDILILWLVSLQQNITTDTRSDLTQAISLKIFMFPALNPLLKKINEFLATHPVNEDL